MDVADLAQLTILFEEHRPKLIAMVRRRSDHRLAARRDPEDIVNEAFIKAQAGWPAFQQSAQKPYAWLYRIVLNCLYDDHDFHSRRRRNRRAEVAFPDHSSMQLAAGLISPRSSPSSAVAKAEYLAELRKRMAQAMELLKPADREVLCMRFCDELSTEDIAHVLDIAPKFNHAFSFRLIGARNSRPWPADYGARFVDIISPLTALAVQYTDA